MYFRRRPRPSDENEEPPPDGWPVVEAALNRAERIHDGEDAAQTMWQEILLRWRAEAERMRRKGLL